MSSDGQVTAGSSSGPVRFPSVKIKQVGSSILWSGSGDLGFLQKIEEAIDGFPSEIKNAGLEQVRSQILQAIHIIRAEALQRFAYQGGRSFIC